MAAAGPTKRVVVLVDGHVSSCSIVAYPANPQSLLLRWPLEEVQAETGASMLESDSAAKEVEHLLAQLAHAPRAGATEDAGRRR